MGYKLVMSIGYLKPLDGGLGSWRGCPTENPYSSTGPKIVLCIPFYP